MYESVGMGKIKDLKQQATAPRSGAVSPEAEHAHYSSFSEPYREASVFWPKHESWLLVASSHVTQLHCAAARAEGRQRVDPCQASHLLRTGELRKGQWRPR